MNKQANWNYDSNSYLNLTASSLGSQTHTFSSEYCISKSNWFSSMSEFTAAI